MQKESLGLIGVGAFGTLAAKHLAPHFDLVLHDAAVDVSALARDLNACAGDLGAAAACDIIVLAVPVQKMRQALFDFAESVPYGAQVAGGKVARPRYLDGRHRHRGGSLGAGRAVAGDSQGKDHRFSQMTERR